MAGRSTKDPRTVLEHLLREQDRTYDEVVSEFVKVAAKLGERGVSITARHLRRLASGERMGTTPSTRRVMQNLFGLPIEELLRPYSPTIASSPIIPTRPQSDVELVVMAAERSRDFFLQQSVIVSSEAVDLLTDEVRDLARVFQQIPLPQILGRLVAAQDAVLSSVEQRQKPANAQQLYFLATVLGGLLAYAGSDVGKTQLALLHARTAFGCAEYANHNGLRAWIRGIQSYICFWANQPREAIRYAQAGAQYLTARHGTGASWLYANEARAWAALGYAERTKALIERAAEESERTEPDELDEFGGTCTFGDPKRLYYAARALANLPEESAAAEAYSIRAIDAYQDTDQPNWDFSCQADCHTSLALARASRGELDGAIDPLGLLFQLRPEQRIHDLVNTATVLHGALNRYSSVAVARNMQEAVENFVRTSLPRFPV